MNASNRINSQIHNFVPVSNSNPETLWMATTETRVATPTLDTERSADVAIIGAGFTGLRAALVLVEAGRRVIVVDSREIGWGASGRNGGQVNPMPPFNGPDELHQLVGSRYAGRISQLYLNSADELFDLIRRYDIDCDARQNGWIRVNHCARARRDNLVNAESWNRLGAEFKPVEGDELAALSGTRAYASGVITVKGGAVHPFKLAQGLAARVLTAGAEIFTNSPINKMVRHGKQWRILSAGGSVNCDHVVLCTNGYTDRLYPHLASSIVPLVPIQIGTEPLNAAEIKHILPAGHTISDTRRVIMYARREPDNRFVIGSLGHMDSQGHISGFDSLIRDVGSIFPSLKAVDWRYRWGGQIAVTADHLPHLHEPEPGVLAGLGYNGRGVAMSHVMGRILAERILGSAAEELPFPVSRIRPILFHRFHTIGSRAVAAYMKLRDRLEFKRSGDF